MRRNYVPMHDVGSTDMGGAVKKIAAYLNKSAFAVLAALALAALSAVLSIIGPDKIGEMTTLMQQALFADIDLGAIAEVGIYLLCIYGMSAVCGFTQHYIMATVTLKTSKRMRGELCEKINRVPQEYFNASSQGDILSRMTNDVSNLQQGLSNGLPGIISSAAQFVGCLLMMFITQWRLAFCVLGVTFVGLFLVMLIMKNSQKYFAARQQGLGDLNGFVEEMYSGHAVVRISRADKKIKNRFEKLNDALYSANWKSQFLSGIMQPIMNVIGNVGYVAVCVVGSILAMNGIIKFGVIVSFILYVRLFTGPLGQIAQGMTNMQMSAAAANRIFDFLEENEMSDESEKTSVLSNIKGDVEFKNVRFAYPDNKDKIIIKNFSAVVEAGQKVAIVGPTGAGKTTMVNLLMRFFEINSGSICIDGVPINSIKRTNVHELFSMVLQDTWLFDGTVRENLVYNLENVTDDDLVRVCRTCGIYRFIRSLPNGFDTVLSESTTISAGQKQLLTIARAMLQNSPMLILDEATSSVDTRTESIIQRAMDERTKGRTSFVIAHR
ncbi:MAG: ABC transporter ATP-binding protein, partial [Clostridia bacterium]|nr:ABC transporter ATP-binding protein [Clostridia bacterium]